MEQIKLTGIARLNVHGIVTGKRYEDMDDALMWNKFAKKIKLPSTLTRNIISPIANPVTGQKDINEIAYEKLVESTEHDLLVDIEFTVVAKLVTRLEEWVKESKLSPGDAEWFIPLLVELKAIKADPS